MPEPSPGVNHADSIDPQHDTGKKDDKKKSRRPASMWKPRNNANLLLSAVAEAEALGFKRNEDISADTEALG
ncbi:LEM3 family/CDC50 family protein [Colletotrichum higginsianum]|nr:LEM3 family/CDC50 family protein [Colletotrichum higginsianum]